MIDKSIFSSDKHWRFEIQNAIALRTHGVISEIPGNVRTCVNKESGRNFKQRASVLLLFPLADINPGVKKDKDRREINR